MATSGGDSMIKLNLGLLKWVIAAVTAAAAWLAANPFPHEDITR